MATITTVITFVGIAIGSSPLHFTYVVQEVTLASESTGHTVTRYISKESDFALADNAFWQKRILWYNALCGMVIPSLIMTVLMLLLTRIIRQTDLKHQKIMSNMRTTTAGPLHATEEANRKTKLLVMITLLYLGSVFPIGITVVLMPIYGSEFKNNVFDPLWCVFDIIALVNAGINFLLLVSMSALFRQTFFKIFWTWTNVRPTTAKNSPDASEAGTASTGSNKSSDDKVIGKDSVDWEVSHEKNGTDGIVTRGLLIPSSTSSCKQDPKHDSLIPDYVLDFIRSSGIDFEQQESV